MDVQNEADFLTVLKKEREMKNRWICPSNEPLDTILCFTAYPNYFLAVWHICNLCSTFSSSF